ncbi:MAG: amidohydrolase [Bacteroidaceae bacterium]|nr:amidohydrolase [Bacteroidaceae bacterium]
MEKLRVALLQNDIIWENVDANLAYCEKALQELDNDVHVAVLPEMFTTGFSMSATQYAEEGEGKTLTALKEWAARYDVALAGSYIARDEGKCYNRGFFVKPCGEVTFYDKRHLFRMGDEGKVFTAGDSRVIVQYREWRIALFICYDLRFPVWSRNVENEYDVALYVASWPQVRAHVWRSLLVARAIENACYVCGVNRVGEDGMSLAYIGDTMAIDFKGSTLDKVPDGEQGHVIVELDGDKLQSFRTKFPTWRDADAFTIQ